MRNLQEVTEEICELKGENMALTAVLEALFRAMPSEQLDEFVAQHRESAELARVVLMSAHVSESVISSFDQYTEKYSRLAKGN